MLWLPYILPAAPLHAAGNQSATGGVDKILNTFNILKSSNNSTYLKVSVEATFKIDRESIPGMCSLETKVSF